MALHGVQEVISRGVEQGIITRAQQKALLAIATTGAALAPAPEDTAAFKPSHILYYLGGLVAMAAMSIFFGMSFEAGPYPAMIVALGYLVIAWKAGDHLYNDKRLMVPAGVFFALALTLVPLTIYCLYSALGIWQNMDANVLENYQDYHTYIHPAWLTLEFATLAFGISMFLHYRMPFILMPIAFTLWYVSMDLGMGLYLLTHPAGILGYEIAFREWFSIVFGLLMLGVAVVTDYRTRSRRDYAFWLYLFGLLTFWGGLSTMGDNTLSGQFAYILLNLLLITCGGILKRRVFAVFGGIGLAFGLGALAHTFFENTLLFPIILCAIGCGVIYMGILWQRNEEQIVGGVRAMLPAKIRAFLIARHQSM